MAVIQGNYFSHALMKMSTFHMMLPNDLPPEMKANNPHYQREMKVLFLLHGFSGNTLDWTVGSLVQEYAGKYNLAVVMPSGDNSFYLDARGTGRAYGEFIGKELVEFIRETFGISAKAEDTYIGGLSMGGFGAIRTALKYPETFGKVFGLSSALIIHNIKGVQEGFQDAIADYDYYTRAFGDLSELESSENNPEYLIEKRLEKGDTIQPLYMACGSEDFLINENRQFYEFLVNHKVDVTYHESTGIHDWKFWNEYLEPAIQWAVEEN